MELTVQHIEDVLHCATHPASVADMLRAGLTFMTAAVLGVAAAPAAATTLHGAGDTGVVNVSNTPDLSEGEQPLAIDPRNPAQMTTVANVFQPNTPAPLALYFGGGGVDDTRVYSTRDGGVHWTTRKLDQGGI